MPYEHKMTRPLPPKGLLQSRDFKEIGIDTSALAWMVKVGVVVPCVPAKGYGRYHYYSPRNVAQVVLAKVMRERGYCYADIKATLDHLGDDIGDLGSGAENMSVTVPSHLTSIPVTGLYVGDRMIKAAKALKHRL